MLILNKKTIISNILLFITAIIWGSSFVAQRVGGESNGPLTFLSARYSISAVFVFVLSLFMKNKEEKVDPRANNKSLTLKAVLLCGLFMFSAAILQQIGLQYTPVGKAAFITSLYIVIIPVIGIFLGKKTNILSWIAVGIATIGLGLLTLKQDLTVELSDMFVFGGSFFWACHILAIDHFLAKGVDSMKIAYGQVTVVAILSTVLAFIFETPSLDNLYSALPAVLYAGVLSGGVGFTFQIIAQKNTDPVVASLIVSLESVFGAISAYFLLNEIMTTKEIIGCVISFIAVIIAQIPLDRIKKRKAKV